MKTCSFLLPYQEFQPQHFAEFFTFFMTTVTIVEVDCETKKRSSVTYLHYVGKYIVLK